MCACVEGGGSRTQRVHRQGNDRLSILNHTVVPWGAQCCCLVCTSISVCVGERKKETESVRQREEIKERKEGIKETKRQEQKENKV